MQQQIALVCAFSLDHLVGAHQERRWHVEAEDPRRLQVEDRFVFGRRLHGKLGRIRKPGTQWSHAPVGVDDRLPVDNGLLKALAGELLTYLVKIRLQRLTRRQHLYATSRELLSIPLGLLFRGLPAARFAVAEALSSAMLHERR